MRIVNLCLKTPYMLYSIYTFVMCILNNHTYICMYLRISKDFTEREFVCIPKATIYKPNFYFSDIGKWLKD